MTKSGVFELPDRNYELISNLYNALREYTPDTFEVFCGKLMIEGSKVVSDAIVDKYGKK